MRFYMAPLEGITGYVYRNAYQTCFGQIDKYFAPFIVASEQKTLAPRDIRDILPENNKQMELVPQILAGKAKEFLHTATAIGELGYRTVNLNLGCPSATVVSKGKGAGFLAKPDELNSFLSEIFEKCPLSISIKTRIGKTEPEEFERLLSIYNQYPIEELVIHPRTQKDFYKNTPNHAVFKEALKNSKNPVCYNGDIFSRKDYQELMAGIPEIDTVMLGRGILMNPGLVGELTSGIPVKKEELKHFHDEIYRRYQEILSGERNVLFKMKEFWSYMICQFPENGKEHKKIKKAQKLYEYEAAVQVLFQ